MHLTSTRVEVLLPLPFLRVRDPSCGEVQEADVDPVLREGWVAAPKLMVVPVPVRRVEIQKLKKLGCVRAIAQHGRAIVPTIRGGCKRRLTKLVERICILGISCLETYNPGRMASTFGRNCRAEGYRPCVCRPSS